MMSRLSLEGDWDFGMVFTLLSVSICLVGMKPPADRALLRSFIFYRLKIPSILFFKWDTFKILSCTSFSAADTCYFCCSSFLVFYYSDVSFLLSLLRDYLSLAFSASSFLASDFYHSNFFRFKLISYYFCSSAYLSPMLLSILLNFCWKLISS